jgi:hypothetical protein
MVALYVLSVKVGEELPSSYEEFGTGHPDARLPSAERMHDAQKALTQIRFLLGWTGYLTLA